MGQRDTRPTSIQTMGSTNKKAEATRAVENSAVEEEEEDYSCPDPGCLFEGDARVVVEHLADAHAHPIYDVKYGEPWNFTLQLSWPLDVIFGVGEDDRSTFCKHKEAAPSAARSVSLHVCVRDPQPQQYRCKMTLEDDNNNNKVTTEPAVCDRVLQLEVPQEIMLSGAETLSVSVQIEQLLYAADNAGGSVRRPKRTRRLPARLASGDWVY
ncbi:uncharacterized protein LOC100821484 isoform X2 [Brachypodium distachyon]|uniref:SIAH-type domain-containing protein n=1 Tax=Brachypodium distachyon TaxID=15368 RepID=A0A0Q3FW96_BRADI|nr:uncharacterized protein LOC100821484 isoform X2 [Brachypodium distachyon]KQK02469.1 hypothetical protein BRADI_2g01643v3 [Brachypodium distachyon]|eukprot:XP_010230389.1 uncharacterized protein LOC100821484 isoform X2 [Brachypodium distachyon]